MLNSARQEASSKPTAAGETPPPQKPFSAPAISLPKGGGAIRGIGEKLAANPVTGTGSMTVPIATSPGRSGFGPQLALSYDSGAGNGPFGFGWSLSLPSITRKTDKGLPRYLDAVESDVFILSGAEDLVPELRPDGHPFEDPESAPGYTIRRYRPRIEGLFARIERWTRQADGDVHWRSFSRDNILTLYGKDDNSRIAASDDPAGPVFAWLISESYDDRGNAIVYEYVPEDDAHVDRSLANERNRLRTANGYLKRIKYGNRLSRLIQPDLTQAEWMFEVVFDYDEGHYEEVDLDPARPSAEQHRFVHASISPGRPWGVRPDPFSSYRSGFEVRTYRRCRRVLMFHHFAELGSEPCLVRSTEFEYADLDMSQPVTIEAELAHQGSTRFASFIQAATQSGYLRDDTQPVLELGGARYVTYLKESLPPLEFEYSRASIQDEVQHLDGPSLENLPVGLDGTTYRWVDLDGEGVSGILTEQAGAWLYKPSLGGGRLGPLLQVVPKPSLAALGSGQQQLLDLAGDGQLDLVALAGPTPGFYERTQDAGWQPYRPFASLPNLRWDDPNLQFLDLTGDGHADIVVSEDQAFTWYPSLAEAGFGAGEKVRQALDEEKGPRLVFADGTQSIYLADMCGDGLTDLVRIRNGQVCYWPNLGYGHFGAQVSMDNAPQFDSPDQFDQRRIRLADIDGSGTTDIIYLGRDGVRLYFNQSGNRWSEPRRLSQFPPTDQLASVMAADLLGNGTGCLVWSSPLPGEARQPLRYIDLMGGQKPHLLVKYINNLGAEIHIRYAPSTSFYLADKLAGKPWIARVPFPVHVVERVETYDRVSRNRFVTRYAYHHGHFDGAEREFRGFGMVEQWDTEEIGTVGPEVTGDEATNWDSASFVPPVLTRTWFHTGAFTEGGRISMQFEREYYREGDPSLGEAELTAAQLQTLLLPDTVLPDGLTAAEAREACRSLKGAVLRQEVYALDRRASGALSEESNRPYSVSERNYTIKCLQPQGQNRHAVFYTHPRETVDFHYERKLIDAGGKLRADPRVTHTLTLQADEYGNVERSVSIGYRRREVPGLQEPEQNDTHITLTVSRFANCPAEQDWYRAGLPVETRTYEVVNPPGPKVSEGLVELLGFQSVYELVDALFPSGLTEPGTAATWPYEKWDWRRNPANAPAGTRLRLIEHVRTLYRKDDLSGPLPLGDVQSLALPYESYSLALTPGLLAQVLQRPRDGQPPENLLPNPAGLLAVDLLGGQVAGRGGYVDPAGDGHWWIPSGRAFYSPNAGHGPAAELAYARSHFFLPHRFCDPFGSSTTVAYDGDPADPARDHNLLPVETRDPLDNRVRAVNDYRVLAPYLVTDPNGNRSRVAFDALGLVVASAVAGKETEALGDRLDDFTAADANPTLATLQAFAAAPRPRAPALLKSAGSRIVYDLDRFRRCGQPGFAATLARETHAGDPLPPGGLRVQLSILHADGFGRAIQTKVQAEPGDAPLRDPQTPATGADVEPGPLVMENGRPKQGHAVERWVGQGRTVYNNKGKPVKQYEPFFSGTHLYEPEPEMTDTGVTPVLFYDPLERLVATLHPNHTWEKVVFDPWQQATWDVNDTVLLDPAADADVKGFFLRFPAGDYAPSWHAQRIAGTVGETPAQRLAEQQAAEKAAVHAGTPAVAHLDSLGRACLAEAHNRFVRDGATVEEKYRTRIDLDIEGNRRQAVDARGRVVMRDDYDMLGTAIHQAGMDGGERWMLNDVIGRPIRAWDSRGHSFRTEYDPLRRPVRAYVQGAGQDPQAEILVGRTEYGEGRPRDVQLNLRTRVFRQYDGVGMVTNMAPNPATGQDEAYDFKGNLLRGSRQLAADYSATPDWSGSPALEPGAFTGSTIYDALNRPTALITPDGSVVRPTYNEANLLERIEANLRGAPQATAFIANVDYNARGQRTLVEYGNGIKTQYEYDPQTLRLAHLLTKRGAAAFPGDCPQPAPAGWPGCQVQNLHYTYDPAGNITHIRDDAQQTVYFRNRRVEPGGDYTYDALYRLIAAEGREHLGQVGGAPIPHSYNDAARAGVLHPGDGNAMGTYMERYVYDAVGNILEMQHRGSDPAHPGWTRTYAYLEPSLIEPGAYSDRLSSTTIENNNPITESYGYDAHGNMLRMPQLQIMQWNHQDQLQMTQRQKVNDEDTDGIQRHGERTYYVYDATGQRARKITELANGSLKDERVYFGGFEIYRQHTGAHAGLVRETLHIMDDKQRIALVETRTQGDEPGVPARLIRYQFGNHLGSTSLELDDQARIISYEEYYPYGSAAYQAVRSQTETPKRYRYTGKERDEESGLYYHCARYNVPWLGRWASPDPIGLAGGPNSYAYAGSNPVRFVDPAGTDPKEAGKLPWYKQVQVAAGEASRQVTQRVSGMLSLIDDPGAAVTGVAKQVAVRYQVHRVGGALAETPPAAAVHALNDVLNPLAQARRASDRAALAEERGDDRTRIQENVKEGFGVLDALLATRALATGISRVTPGASMPEAAEATAEATSSGTAEATVGAGSPEPARATAAVTSTEAQRIAASGARVPKMLSSSASPATRAPANQVIVSPGANNAVTPSALMMAQRTGQTLRAAGPRALAGADDATLVAHGVRSSGTMGSRAVNLGPRYGALAPSELAQALVNDMGWRGGTLRLAACNTGVSVPGLGPYGLRLSQELSKLGSPTTVIAPYGRVNFLSGGGLPAVLTPGGKGILKPGQGWNYY